MAAGAFHSLILKQDGTVWAAGDNRSGQLGDGTKTERPGFVQVFSGDALAMAAGNRHSMILKQDMSIVSTGRNSYGQLGDGPKTERIIFLPLKSSASQTSLGMWL